MRFQLAKNHLTILISDFHQHKKLVEVMCECNVGGATIISGNGSVPSFFLNLLGLDSVKKELMLIVSPEDEIEKIHDAFYSKYNLAKKGSGICFSLPLSRTLGVSYLMGKEESENKGDQVMFELAVIIVDRDKGEEIVEHARLGGATGATILHGRGSGAHKHEKFFNLNIEPEKEIILFVLEKSKIAGVLKALEKVIDFNKPNSGIFFTTELSAVNGLIEQGTNLSMN